VYTLFEDPDYSRSLATPTARGSKSLRIRSTAGDTVQVQLAADRREYNPASPIFFACFTDDPADEPNIFGRLVVIRRFGRNVLEPIAIEGPHVTPPGGQVDVTAGYDVKILAPPGTLPAITQAVIFLTPLGSEWTIHVFDATGTKIVDSNTASYVNRPQAVEDLKDMLTVIVPNPSTPPASLPPEITHGLKIAVAAVVNVFWVEGVEKPKTDPTPPIPTDGITPPPPSIWIKAGALYRLHVEGIIEPGDTLELQLDLVTIGSPGNPLIRLDGNTIVVDVAVTDRPVMPPPQSGYGLLRKDLSDNSVSCVRFAWSPEASRIELINPDDLKKQIVRRRAVFRWTDVVRPPLSDSSYAVQKLTSGGSTRAGLSHFDPTDSG
jgi:hypothetical protein